MGGDEKICITKEGLERAKKEYEFLKDKKAGKTSGDVPKIWESEDLNPEYILFQEDLNLIDSKISELSNIIKNAVLIKPPSRKEAKEAINPGAKVELEIDGSEKDEFTIVGSSEANPSLGRISLESPVGKALLGHKVGDIVVVSSPIKTTYRIKKIKYE